MTYNMQDYFNHIVNDCEQLASETLGKEVVLKPVATLLLEDDHKGLPARQPQPYDIYSLLPVV